MNRVDTPSTAGARRSAMSPRARRATFAGAVLVLIAGAAWVVVATRDDSAATRGTSAGGEMRAMEGMGGMSMTADGSVQLTARQIADFGITFGTADMRTLESEVRTVGIVTFDETRVVQVAPKFGGFVERLYVDFTGKAVQRGQPLLDIYSPELVAAQQELLLARRLERTMDESIVPGVPAGSSDLVAAARRRFQLWDISEEQIDQILSTGTVRRTLTLYAPSSGVVVEKKVVQGQATMPGEHLYTIANLSEVWIDVELRESDVGIVRTGTSAEVEFAAYPGRPFKGRVGYVYPTLQEESRTVRARVALANPAGLLKPGMYATVRLRAPMRSALTVPASAVLQTGERNIVFVDMGVGSQSIRLMPHEVELGRTAREYTEILAGLEPGQRVVTSAQFLLDSESNLGEVMKAMMGQMGAGDMGNMKDMPGMEMKGTEGMDKGADMKGMKMPPSPRR
jgi:Cu(I)/Ag(I) efflux system membrane fusion protein